jgi:hypothetical protein
MEMSENEAESAGGPVRRLITCGVVAMAFSAVVLLIAWLGLRSPWTRDPFAIGAFEELIEAQGFVFEDTNEEDGLDGYVVREQGGGRWAERLYVHPETGAEIRLKRSIRGGDVGGACTVTSLNAGGREALVRVAEEFSPYLTRRIAEAAEESERIGQWVRVTAPDFDISVKPDWLSIDSRPGEYTGPGIVGRSIERLFWRLSGRP